MSFLPAPHRRHFLEKLTEAQKQALEYDWRFWGRPKQFTPPGNWGVWLALAGRGFGKTRLGAEFIRSEVCGDTPLTGGRCSQIAIVGETVADVRETMVGDGKAGTQGSGILQVHPNGFRPQYEPSKRRLTWPNGAIATLYNATEPDQLRGPEHDLFWADELAKWKYVEDTWDQISFGLRKGKNPRGLITTTPRPIFTLKQIMADPQTFVTRGSMLENRRNLASRFIDTIVGRYGGTRFGRQEIEGEVIDDVPGALWSREKIDELRLPHAKLPPLVRIVVAIDPAVTSNEDSDETGIVVVGRGIDGDGYVLEDLSGIFKPTAWAMRAVGAYRSNRADRIVAEVNNGGEMVESTIRVVDKEASFRAVHASRGKVIRAEPISALYEKNRVHHVGSLPQLEDQMCAFTSDFDRSAAGYSPDRMDALVWGLTDLMLMDADVPDISAPMHVGAGEVHRNW